MPSAQDTACSPGLLPLSDDSFIPHWCAAGDSPQDPLRCSPRVHPCSGYQANRPCVWLVGVALEEVGTHDIRFSRGQGTDILGGLGTPAPSWDHRLDPQAQLRAQTRGTLEGCGLCVNEHINPGARLCTCGTILNNSSMYEISKEQVAETHELSAGPISCRRLLV